MKLLTYHQKLRNLRRARDSFRNNLNRKGKKYRAQSGYSTPLYSKEYSFDVEGFCLKNNVTRWDKKYENLIRIEEKSNLFDNPEKVLKILLAILFNAKYQQAFPTINFNGKVQFGSLYLIDNICWEIARKRKWGFRHQNMTQEDQSLLSNLRSFFSSDFENEQGYLLNEKVNINRSKTPLASQPYKAKSKLITDMVIKGVRENSDRTFELSHEGYQAISSTIGEHFDNILLHAPDAEFGYLCGYYDKTNKEVSILIYNFGKSIYETLNDTLLPVEVQLQIDLVIESHTKKNYFNLHSNNFTKENALTLLALQEGISSRINFDKSRGHGIMDYIEHCFELNPNVKISLVSGYTAIKIDSKYQIQRKYFVDRERRVLSLNKENDLLKKPDSDYVRNMGICFPGLIIETRIPLFI